MPWLTLDLDGTLAPWPLWGAVGPILDPELERRGAMRAFGREIRRRMAEEPATAYDFDGVLEAVRAELGLAEPFPSVLELASRAAYPPALNYPDAAPALARLRAAGWRIAVATNGLARYQTLALAGIGLEVDAVIAPDTAGGVAKPDARFLRSLPGLGRDEGALEGAVHAGDGLAADVLAARAAGVRGAWVWRAMPPELATVPAAERIANGRFAGVHATAWATELERDPPGRRTHLAPPVPDFVARDLLELAGLLGA